jgi:hypothetical protein
MSGAEILKQSMGARNRKGMGLSYRPARAELVFVVVLRGEKSIPGID